MGDRHRAMAATHLALDLGLSGAAEELNEVPLTSPSLPHCICESCSLEECNPSRGKPKGGHDRLFRVKCEHEQCLEQGKQHVQSPKASDRKPAIQSRRRRRQWGGEGGDSRASLREEHRQFGWLCEGNSLHLENYPETKDQYPNGASHRNSHRVGDEWAGGYQELAILSLRRHDEHGC